MNWTLTLTLGDEDLPGRKCLTCSGDRFRAILKPTNSFERLAVNKWVRAEDLLRIGNMAMDGSSRAEIMEELRILDESAKPFQVSPGLALCLDCQRIVALM